MWLSVRACLQFPGQTGNNGVGKAKAVAVIPCHCSHEGGNVGNGECVVLRRRVVNGVGVQRWPLLWNVLYHCCWTQSDLTTGLRIKSPGSSGVCIWEGIRVLPPRRAEPRFPQSSNHKKGFNQWECFLRWCGADLSPEPHLDAVFHLHVSQQFAVDAEETELSLVIVNHTVSLGGRLDETRSRALLWGLQGPQQVSIHGMDQTRTLCGTHQSQHVMSSLTT